MACYSPQSVNEMRDLVGEQFSEVCSRLPVWSRVILQHFYSAISMNSHRKGSSKPSECMGLGFKAALMIQH